MIGTGQGYRLSRLGHNDSEGNFHLSCLHRQRKALLGTHLDAEGDRFPYVIQGFLFRLSLAPHTREWPDIQRPRCRPHHDQSSPSFSSSSISIGLSRRAFVVSGQGVSGRNWMPGFVVIHRLRRGCSHKGSFQAGYELRAPSGAFARRRRLPSP